MNSVTQVWAEDDASQELLRDILEQVEDLADNTIPTEDETDG